MPGKNRVVKQINLTPRVTTGAVVTAQAANFVSPARPRPPAPEDLALATAIEHRAVTSRAKIEATWTKPSGVQPERYTIQWSTDPAFPDNGTNGASAAGPSATIPNLAIATLYYVRVLAWVNNAQGDWSDAVSITTANDIIPPDPPGIPTWTWLDTGDLIVQASEPTNSNYHWLEINIWSDATKTTLLTTAFFAGGTYNWTLAENKRVTGSSGDAAVYIELRSQSWTGYFSSAVVPAVQPNRPAPSAPTSLTTSWASDTGTAGPDCTITCTAPAGAVRYVWTIDGNTIPSTVPGLVYGLDTNRAQHSGTPDPALSISVVAYDALGQASPTASTTATNAVPPDATSVTITGGAVSTFGISISATQPADFSHHLVRIIKNGVTLATVTQRNADWVYQTTSNGTFEIGVKLVDVFGQVSANETLSSAVVIDALDIEKLRADAIYTDSDGNLPATLDALKDGNTSSGGVTYGATGGWRWTQIERPFLDRYGTTTVSLSSSATIYIGYSKDGVTWTWYYGGTTSAGRWQPGSSTASEATAQAGAVGVSAGKFRIDLSALVEARFIRFGHRHPSVAYTLREFYARSLVRGDDAEFETFTGLHMQANSIAADRLFVSILSAISADMGTITAGTVTGATIQTATSGERIVLNSSNLTVYNSSNVAQVAIAGGNGGKVAAGQGAVWLDVNGLGLKTQLSYADKAAVRWEENGGTGRNGYLAMLQDVVYNTLFVRAENTGGRYGKVAIAALGSGGGGGASITLDGLVPGNGIQFHTNGTKRLEIQHDGVIAVSSDLTVGSGVNVGTASGATAGEIRGRASVAGSSYGWDVKNTGGTSSGTTTRVGIGQGKDDTNGGLIQYHHFDDEFLFFNRKSSTGTVKIETTGGGIKITNAGHITPTGTTGTQNLGDATNYFGDISYKTITDRGCLALIDAWELPDGRIVSAREALKALRAHPTEKTIYGEVKLDYASVPRHSHKPAPIAEDDVYEDNAAGLVDKHNRPLRSVKHKKGDKLGADGVEMTALFSVMLTAFRELITENEDQETRITQLEAENAQMRSDMALVMQRLAALEQAK